MKYTITFIKKNGKVKGKVGCNNDNTKNYLINTWKEENATKKNKGICIIVNNETKEEIIIK